MRIAWLIDSPVLCENGEPYFQLASARLRAEAPATTLRARGHDCQLVNLAGIAEPSELARHAHRWDADVVVVSKIIVPWRLEAARDAKRRGARLIVDVCDNRFELPNYGEAYTQLCRWADGLVACSDAMAEVIRGRFDREADVIEESCEAPYGVPRFAPRDEAIELLWFGAAPSLATLDIILPGLDKLGHVRPVRLHIISDPRAMRRIDDQLAAINDQCRGRLHLRFSPWSPQTLWQGMRNCDAVTLPSKSSEWWQVKSPNRLIETIQSGRFAFAYPLPSYRPLADYAWLGDDLAAGISSVLEHPHDVCDRIKRGQNYVAKRYGPELIGNKWQRAVERAADKSRARRPVAHFAAPLLLRTADRLPA